MSREVNRIAAYLRGRPIAPILEQSDEKENLIALKVMSILDSEMKKNQLYDRIQNVNCDTLLMQLMQFHTFQSFKFYEYNVKREIKQLKLQLQCTACGLLGPYAYILSHMAINHDLHIGLKMCLYCDRVELQKHVDNSSLERCYRNYLRERNINDWDTKIVREIVTEFYELLKKIAEKFSITTIRNNTYAAKRTKRVNSVNGNTNFLALLDEEFNQIDAALNMQGDNLPCIDTSGVSSEATDVHETKYSPDNDDDDDDEVTIVGISKNEPPLDIQAEVEPSTSGMYYRRHSRDSAITESVTTAHLLPPSNQFERSDAERFGLFVAQSLSKLPTEIQRRKLEIQIETAILNAKKAAFQ